MSRADIDSVLRKVRALRDLAARAGTLAEAQTAAAQADAILQKHRLTDADVEASTGVANEAISDAEEPLWSGGARLDTTASRLAAALGEHYGCAVYSSRDYFMGRTCKIEIKVAGRSSDVACLRYMFAWLRVEIDRLAQAHRAATRGSFKHGAVSGIAITLRRSAQSAAAEHGATGGSASAAMTIASRQDAAKAWLATAHGKMGKGRDRSGGSIDESAYLDGVRAGRGLHLGTALPAASGLVLPSEVKS